MLTRTTQYKELLCTTQYYSSTILYYTVLLQYYSVLQSTTPYYTVLLQYYSVLQSTTPYYTVLLQYYSVLQRLQSTTPYWKVLHEMSFTMRGATGVIVQHHQILRLLVTYETSFTLQCTEQQRPPSNITKYCACHEKSHSSLILVRYETLFTMRGATGVIVQPHQVLRLPRMTIQNVREIWWKQTKRHLQSAADPSMIRDRSENETVSPQPASQPRLLFTPTTAILYWKIQHFALRLSFQISRNSPPRKVTLQLQFELHQMLHLPRKVPLELHQMLRLPRKVTLELHQTLRLPRKVTWLFYYMMNLLLLDSTTTGLSSSVTWLYLTLLLLGSFSTKLP